MSSIEIDFTSQLTGFLVLYVLYGLALLAGGWLAARAFIRRQLMQGLTIAAVILMIGYGPVLLSNWRSDRLGEALSSATVAPEAFDLRGKTVAVVRFGDDFCDLCEPLVVQSDAAYVYFIRGADLGAAPFLTPVNLSVLSRTVVETREDGRGLTVKRTPRPATIDLLFIEDPSGGFTRWIAGPLGVEVPRASEVEEALFAYDIRDPRRFDLVEAPLRLRMLSTSVATYRPFRFLTVDERELPDQDIQDAMLERLICTEVAGSDLPGCLNAFQVTASD